MNSFIPLSPLLKHRVGRWEGYEEVGRIVGDERQFQCKSVVEQRLWGCKGANGGGKWRQPSFVQKKFKKSWFKKKPFLLLYEFSLCGELEMRGDGSRGKVLDHLSCCILWISLWGKEKGGFLQGEHENRGGRWIKTCQRNRRRREKLQEQDLDRVATHPRYSICLQLHSLLLYFWSKMQVKNDCSAPNRPCHWESMLLCLLLSLLYTACMSLCSRLRPRLG